MKKTLSLILGLFMTSTAATAQSTAQSTAQGLHEFTVKTIDGEDLPLSQYQGKVVLIVNTASKCGFTSQYSELEALHQKFSPQGFTVIGFPSNDFMGQEPGTNSEIKSFCQKNYGVTFPITEKGAVKGKEKQPVFQFLAAQSGEGDPGWNFVKFLIDKNGKVAARYSSMTKPSDPRLVGKIEELLAAK